MANALGLEYAYAIIIDIHSGSYLIPSQLRTTMRAFLSPAKETTSESHLVSKDKPHSSDISSPSPAFQWAFSEHLLVATADGIGLIKYFHQRHVNLVSGS